MEITDTKASMEMLLQLKSAQLNNKNPRDLYGAAAQYKKYLKTSKFKLVVYWNVNEHNQFYTNLDKQQNKNRRYIPSLDWELGAEGSMRTNQETGFLQLIDYAFQNAARMDKAMLIVNEYLKEEEHTILILNPKQIALSLYVNPIFKEHTQSGGKYYNCLEAAPIRIDKMRI